MAEIIRDIRGAERRGLYATRSMTKPSSTVAISTRGSARYMGMAVVA